MANKTFKSLTPQGLDTTYKVPATAPEYAATNTYAVGDLAVYQGVLYKCTTAIDTPEAWTVQHWQDTTIGDEVSSLMESISDIDNEVFNIDIIESNEDSILVPINANEKADILELSESVTEIKSIGKNLYPYGTIPNYYYGFYNTTLANAKSSGIKLQKGEYTVSYDFESETNRIWFRAFLEDGTVISSADGSPYFKADYYDNSTYPSFYWQTSRYCGAILKPNKKFTISVFDEPVWFLFCSDNNASASDVTSVQIEQGFDTATEFDPYTETVFPINTKNISVTPYGMIKLTHADNTTVSSKIQFYKNKAEVSTIIAEDFDGTSVENGSYRIYGGKLFQSNTKTTESTIKVFRPKEWNEVLLADKVAELAKNIEEYNTEKDANPFLKPFFRTSKSRLFAHTGLTSTNAPENTLPAYIAAGEAGYFGLEMDVQETSDGYFIMMHDTTLDRTTNGTGSIADKTFAEISALHIKDHEDIKIPTLEEALDICKMYGMLPNIEIKSSVRTNSFANLIQVVKDKGVYSFCTFSGGYYATDYFRAADKNIPYVIIVQTGSAMPLTDVITKAKNTKYNMGIALESALTFDDSTIKECHDNNIFIIGFTPTSKENVQALFDRGVDFVTTQNVIIP